MKLSKKAQRLLDYLIEYEIENDGESPTLGEIRKACKTTTITLLSKTYPELERYAEFVMGDKNEM